MRRLYDNEVPDPDTLDLPQAVRTPGRTWTTYPEELPTTGDGTITVDGTDEIDTYTIGEALETHPEQVQHILFQGIAPNKNRFTALHAQNLENGVFIHIPDGTQIADPITITVDSETGYFPGHILISVGDDASARILEQHTGNGDWTTLFTEAAIGKHATLDYAKINALGDTFGYTDNHARVKENGTMNWLVLSTGGDLYRNQITTQLDGPRSTLQYRLGFLAAQQQHMDITTRVVHAADNTRCNMDSSGVALDASRTVYKGVQEVSENAEGTKSFQDEKTVMIGPDCEADTTPQLRIDNNDVEATHAATTGHIDETDLFYMKSRGLPETEAVREIITGMFDTLINESGFDAAGDALHRKIQDTLG